MAVHPTAIVEDGAKLGGDVEIGPFCVVGPHVVLADGVRLLSHVSITGHTEIGARTVVHPHAALGGEGQIRKNDFAEARLVIGEDNVIREGVTMSCGSRKGGGITRIGNDGYFMALSHVGHDCVVGNGCTFANSVALGGHVQVDDNVTIGGNTAVQQFCRIGRLAMVGGLTGVNRDIIPFGIAFGDHAVLGGLNLIGLKRKGLSRETINALRGAYRAIFRGTEGHIPDRAAAAKKNWAGIAEVQELTDFILAEGKQSICTARVRGDHEEN
jgi:UDP-N-acetylglucosamine acyltransferase